MITLAESHSRLRIPVLAEPVRPSMRQPTQRRITLPQSPNVRSTRGFSLPHLLGFFGLSGTFAVAGMVIVVLMSGGL